MGGEWDGATSTCADDTHARCADTSETHDSRVLGAGKRTGLGRERDGPVASENDPGTTMRHVPRVQAYSAKKPPDFGQDCG
eukprot:5002643-Prymnesium_polylepis.1